MSIDVNAARAARREATQAGPEVVIGDSKFVLPVEMPFEVTEHLATLKQAEQAKDNSLISGAILSVLRVLFGDQYEEFMKEQPSMQDIEVLLEGLMEEYGMAEKGDDD